MGTYPAIFKDSIEIGADTLKAINVFDVAHVTVMVPKRAKKLLGDKGADGAIYITTIKPARLRNWNYLKTKSEIYRQSINSPEADSCVQYFLNGRSLSDKEVPGIVFQISDKNFRRIEFNANDTELSDSINTKNILFLYLQCVQKGF